VIADTCKEVTGVPPIESTIEIEASPSDVFAYATDPTRFAEWQDDVVSVRMHRATRSPRIPGSRRPVGSGAPSAR
jgi:uncharacterized protein YndB with AHSA1/START domain